ncbi:MAG: hypothetical protein KJO54_06090 [Gammaproteobacteria bacterium]|nr:hypothetical protein [Gammaproteobacteria bacterium]
MSRLPIAALAAFAASYAWGDGIADLNVYGNEIRATVELANGVEADVTVAFEQASGLDVSSIGLSADLIDPLDPALLSRLPGTLVSVPAAFPLLLTIEPPNEGTLSFLGVATVSLHTHNLGYSVGSPFRLFVADDGGSFEDITDRASSGSYRVRGSQGEFCEFMIVADLRQIGAVIDSKFDRVENILNSNQSLVNNSLHSQLANTLAGARTAYDAGDEVSAIRELDAFSAMVRQNAGGAIPNLWRARDDIINLDGQLRAAASSLRYSLSLLANDLP